MEDTSTRRPPVARIANQSNAQPPAPPEVLEPIGSGNGTVDVEMSDDEKLERIFSAKEIRNRSEEDIHVKSLGMTITIRELTQRELDDIFEMFEDRSNPRAKGRKRRISEINAFMVSRAIIRPDFTSEKARQGLLSMYGTGLLHEALPKIFKPLEVTSIAERILALSGGDEDAITVAENL